MILRRLPPLPTWPVAFGGFDDVRREMDRLFDSLTAATGFRTAGVFPAINVSDSPEALYVRAELPGIKTDDLEISVENDTLTIAGERKMSREDERASYHRREREWGQFRRSFSVPVRVDASKVEARYLDGVLTVTLPKAREARPRQIPVQAGA